MATLKLKTSDGKSLVLSVFEKNYCDLFLEAGNETIRLGTDTFEQIRRRMLSNLCPPYNPRRAVFGDRGEVEYFSILSLMGPLAALYALPVREKVPDGLGVIRWLDLVWDKDINNSIMRLGEDDIQAWLAILEKTTLQNIGENTDKPNVSTIKLMEELQKFYSK